MKSIKFKYKVRLLLGSTWEIIVRQMSSRRKPRDAGDTDFAPNEIVERLNLK